MELSFKTLTLQDLEFELPMVDEQSFKEILQFVDFLGYDNIGKRYVCKLNLEKCATIDNDNLKRLARYGIYLSNDVLREIEKLRSERLVNISIQGGDLVITLTPSALSLIPNYCIYELKTKTYRAKPKDLWKILDHFQNLCKVNIAFDLKQKLSFSPLARFTLRDYQARCYDAWRGNGFKGVIVLSTAAGKTFIALQAIADLKVRTMIIVPSIDLLYQWKKKISLYLNAPNDCIGIYGGGSKEVKDITIITYKSAYLNAEILSDKFMLIIADEAHHSIAKEFRRIFDVSIARYRMGLTATPMRSDGLHKDYEQILGPIINPVSELELQDKGYIAKYDVKRIYVELELEAFKEYQRQISIYNEYCENVFPNVKNPKRKFELCLKYAAKDPKARDALRARSKARIIALSADKKIELVGELLSKYWDKKVLIFSRYVDIVEEVSRKYLIPLIVADTSVEERKAILEMFRKGEVTKIASGMTLEEGIDVPDAQIGIIISGSGSNREYLQRIGRLLRPKMERAIVIELVTKGTIDQQLTMRRRRFQEWDNS